MRDLQGFKYPVWRQNDRRQAVLEVAVHERTKMESAVTHEVLDSVYELAFTVSDGKSWWGRPAEPYPDDFAGFVGGWDHDKWERLIVLADRWHLNGMRAGCNHQGDWRKAAHDAAPSSDWLSEVPPCPETGYKCGHAWLAEPVPDDVVDELRELLDTPELLVL